MALSLRSTCAISARAVTNRRTTVVRHSLGEDVGKDVMRTFTPSRTGNKEDWKGTETPFTGSISHHEEKGRPFKDGWTSNPKKVEAKKKVVASSQEPEETEEAENNIVGFMNKAVEQVVAHNFVGDKTEPQQWKETEGMGFKGDAHQRGRDGFHVKKV